MKNILNLRKEYTLNERNYQLKIPMNVEILLYAMAHNLGWLHARIQNDKLNEHLYNLKESA